MGIKAAVTDEVGLIRIDRPDFRNALSRAMWDEIPASLAKVRRAGAKVIVITGGAEAFAAGADLTELELIQTEEQARAAWTSIHGALNAVASCELPVIAQISGPCMGGGCLLAIACDLRYCEPGAKFTIPVAQLGIVLDAGNVARLASLVGRGVAAEMLMTACALDAHSAERVGLVNKVFPADDLATFVAGIASQIKANNGDSIRAAKRDLARIVKQASGDEDHSEVIASYLSPDFSLRVGKALKKWR